MERWLEELKERKSFIMYGAGVIARQVAGCLMEKPYELRAEYFIVSDKKDNPDELFGSPVIDLDTADKITPRDAVIVIGTSEKHLDPILEKLRERGYTQILPLTFNSDLWERVREQHFIEYQRFRQKPYRTLEEEVEKYLPGLPESGKGASRVHIYTVQSHADKVLQEDLSRYSWEIPIQAGASLTDKRICEICDNQGEHISDKNQKYCELTALYWIWKHDKAEYIGLDHYRRHFEVNPELLKALAQSDIDAVLTIPILNIPNVRAVYEQDHIPEDWNIMMEGLSVLAPDYIEAAECLESGKYYHAYNMFIMRREVLENYCAWLFPILTYCEARCREKADPYQNRYIGFLAERLMAIYFLHHEEHYKIVHARKHFAER
ncbi:MAG: DUF4422 domain-containing protein [Lachnospiraceae bacterium]|nr:DUF4422 domain-containing protein [Lachnospiraceae bacterium]